MVQHERKDGSVNVAILIQYGHGTGNGGMFKEETTSILGFDPI